MLDYPGLKNDPDQVTALTEIMHLVDMEPGVTSDGWSRQTARLFAIDTALVAVRRNMALMSEADRQSLVLLLQQARTLVTSRRDDELDFVQAALEAHLSQTAPGRERQVWLTAIDALLPSPYRAALVSTKSALSLGATEALVDLAELLRDRLLSRLREGSLHLEPSSPLDLTG
ncbi:MAG TPA: hypothetical protein VF148_08660 [Acidimicrobiia bacterium]